MQFQFSNDVAKLQPSAIREILKFTSMPGVISFAAGNPAPEAFPTELIADLSSKLLREHPVLAMQYSITEGYPELREQLKQWMTEKHCFSPETDDLIITSGAQQANELSCKVLLNPCSSGLERIRRKFAVRHTGHLPEWQRYTCKPVRKCPFSFRAKSPVQLGSGNSE